MQYVVADTGVWHAMFDERDPYWGHTEEKEELFGIFDLVIPWPTLYETLRTRMVRNRRALQRLQEYLKRPHVIFLDDASYREEALDLAFASALRDFRPLSMVDCMIRLMLEDVNVRVDCLATFNRRDFEDVCYKRHIELF